MQDPRRDGCACDYHVLGPSTVAGMAVRWSKGNKHFGLVWDERRIS
jgi:hypothetical protein